MHDPIPLDPAWLALAPPLLAILAALLLRRVVASLLLGVAGAALLLAGFDLWRAITGTLGYLVDAATDSGHQWILTFALMLGGLMQVLRASGGSSGLAQRFTQVADSRRGGQLTAWGLGFVFFFDDYANTLFVGSSMRPVTRRLGISREKLAFIVDATAAPVASLAPVSSWIAVEVGYIADQLQALSLPGDAYAVFLATVPLRFYPLLMLAFGLMVAWSGRDFGPMAQAEARALASGDAADASPATAQAAPAGDALAADMGATGGAGHWRLAALPLAVVLVTIALGLFVTGREGALAAGEALSFKSILTHASSSKAMVVATLTGGLTALALAAQAGRLPFGRGLLIWGRGALGMAPVVGVLLLAWSLGAACRDLQTARYIVTLLGGDFAPGLLPAATFVVSALVSFATGTSWGTMGIVFPLAAPLAHQLAPGNEALLVGSLAAVLAGSVFGDHCSPISDTTIMSALAADCDQVAHVRTQLPYALLTGLIGLCVCSIPVGMGWLPVWVALPLALMALYLALRLLSSGSASPKRQPQP